MKGRIFLLLVLFSHMAFADETEDKIKVRLDDAINIKASITSFKRNALSEGMDQMRLRGSSYTEPLSGGRTKIKITWDTLELEGVTKELSKALESEVIVHGQLIEGQEFSAIGDSKELLSAWSQLQGDEEGGASSFSSSNFKDDDPRGQGSFGEEVSQDLTDSPDFSTPSIDAETVDEPIILTTEDGCQIKVDLEQMVAIVQERVLEDGIEVSGCSESFTRYPITAEFSTCPVNIDLESLKVFEQYTLGYDDPNSGGRIEVQGCTPDDERFIAINETVDGCTDRIGEDAVYQQSRLVYELRGIRTTVRECADNTVSYTILTDNTGCSIRHDFTSSVSYQQVRSTYVKEGQTIEIASCHDDEDQSYTHQITRNTCSPIVEGEQVVFQNRKYITVGSSETYISECTPNTSSAVAVFSEACNSPAYTHDFDSGQSYRNVNYYYMDGSTPVMIKSCVASEDTYTHYDATDVCENQNDDTQRHTKVFGKTFISESNSPVVSASNRIYISSCKQIGSTVEYTKTGNKWKVNSSVVEYLKTENNAHCPSNSLATDWVTTSNNTINKQNSDETPSWTHLSTQISWRCNPGLGSPINQSCLDCDPQTMCNSAFPTRNPAVDRISYSYNCSTPSCSVTTLNSHPVYQRPDGSEYYETSTVVSQALVCGNGSKLNGTME